MPANHKYKVIPNPNQCNIFFVILSSFIISKWPNHLNVITTFFCFCYWCNSPQWARASSFTRFLDHTQRRITIGRIPLEEWSARRRDLYLTTHDTYNRQTSMPPVGFEPTISEGERPQTYVLNRAAAGPVCHTFYFNTLRTGDADLRFYVTTVQDGWRRFAFLTRLNSVHLQVLLCATPQGGMFPEVSHPQALPGSLVSISWKFQFTKIVSELVINF